MELTGEVNEWLDKHPFNELEYSDIIDSLVPLVQKQEMGRMTNKINYYCDQLKIKIERLINEDQEELAKILESELSGTQIAIKIINSPLPEE